MSAFHVQQTGTTWRVLEGNLIIWAECPTEKQAQLLAKLLDALNDFSEAFNLPPTKKRKCKKQPSNKS